AVLLEVTPLLREPPALNHRLYTLFRNGRSRRLHGHGRARCRDPGTLRGFSRRLLATAHDREPRAHDRQAAATHPSHLLPNARPSRGLPTVGSGAQGTKQSLEPIPRSNGAPTWPHAPAARVAPGSPRS